MCLKKYYLLLFFLFFLFSETKAQDVFKKIFYFNNNYSGLIFPTDRIDYSVIGAMSLYPDVDGNHYSIVKINKHGVINWVKNINVNYVTDNYVTSFLCEDGNYLILGKTNVLPDRDDQAIIKIDTNGNVLWSKKYLINGLLSHACEIEDGYLICGSYFDNSTNGNDIRVLKIDKNGNMIWAKRYGGEANDEGRSIFTRNDGSVLISGRTGGFSDIVLINIDIDGNVLWSKTYSNEPDDEWDLKVLETEDEELISINYSESYDPLGDVYILRLSHEGDPIWSKVYDMGFHDTGSRHPAFLDDFGNIIFVGKTANILSEQEDGWFMKVNSENGNVISSKVFDTGLDEIAYCPMKDDSNIYTLGIFYDTTNNANGIRNYLIKSNLNGNFYCGEIDVMPTVTEVTTEVLNFIFSIDSSGTEDTLIVTITDATWTDSTICYSAIGVEEISAIDKFKIYPNPNNGEIQVEYLLPEGSKGYIEVLDINGKILQNYPLHEGKHTHGITINNQSTGLYFARLCVDDRYVYTDKIAVIK
ncbi:MAG: hypothetical protein POELPBGB_01358 [Bacteroidia bacterium]|nr:hypothetical protein [Bacteroidia bacterium]